MTPLLAQRPSVDRAFERLYQRHVGDVYRYALVVLRNPADAEDVTQTTFMNAYRAFQRGEQPRKAQNWLISIAHNVCRQRFRQSARRPDEVAFDEEIGDATLEDEKGPSAEDIQRALGHLQFNQRAALVMRELEGRSYAEIAEILALSVSAVETLLFRARRALREQLEGSLTCGEAELAISKQIDGRLSRPERGALRAHLRECDECAHFARSQRAQRAAFKTLAALPLPASLGSFFGGGGVAVGTGLAVKTAAMLAAGVVVAGTGYEVVQHRAHPTAKAASAAGSASSAADRAAFVARSSAVPLRPPAEAAGGTAKAQASKSAKSSSGNARGHSKVKTGKGQSAQGSSNPGLHVGQTKAEHQAKKSRAAHSKAVGRAVHANSSRGRASAGGTNGGKPVNAKRDKAQSEPKSKDTPQAPTAPPPPQGEGGKKPK